MSWGGGRPRAMGAASRRVWEFITPRLAVSEGGTIPTCYLRPRGGRPRAMGAASRRVSQLVHHPPPAKCDASEGGWPWVMGAG